jgi:hypothetical protein
MIRPSFFDKVKKKSQARWEQLESDPGLAAPWHQLFRQVQSPRHVLSELLQNADDAKATWARAEIKNGIFEFSHNGDDFDEKSFGSLCQFGLSNKRHLHTIGFRGVGFKSVFSLGDRVDVVTPTLAFAFEKKRFTEPIWTGGPFTSGETTISVTFSDELKSEAIQSDFSRWMKSPFPLLFFRHINDLQIGDRVIKKQVLRNGPIENSAYIKIIAEEEKDVLFIESQPEEFPEEAVREIKDERGSDEIDLPPCSVQIIMTADDQNERIFTVLPTDVEPLTPFSMNAPFIQDPARKEIKHPATSPTNRWLLTRIGKLAAEAMMAWLENKTLGIKERANAYDLFSEPLMSPENLHESCTELIIEAFYEQLDSNRKAFLACDGNLYEPGDIVILPPAILNTWSVEEVLKILAPDKKNVLSTEIADRNVKCFQKWELFKCIDVEDIAERLLDEEEPFPPRPKSLDSLTFLWEYLFQLAETSCRYYQYRGRLRELTIVPVRDHDELLPADKTLVLGGREANITSEDWEFLTSYVNIVDPKWLENLRADDEESEEENEKAIRYESARELLVKMRLNQPVGMEQIINMAAKSIFSQDDPGHDGIRLAQIAAVADVRVSDQFKYLCRDGLWRDVRDGLFVMEYDLEELLPKILIEKSAISEMYYDGILTENMMKFREWINLPEKSKLRGFILPDGKFESIYERRKVEEFSVAHGGIKPDSYYYTSSNFRIRDFDWDGEIWSFWEKQAEDNTDFWKNLLSIVFRTCSDELINRSEATIKQLWGSHSAGVQTGRLKASWIIKLSNKKCVPDTFGNIHIPSELFRLTPETQALANVEKFLHRDFDRPEYHQLLDLLGVRNKPTGYKSLIERLRALSRAESPPISHLVDLYRSMDRVLLNIDTEETRKIKKIFTNERLVFSSDSTWESLAGIFKDNPEEIPGLRVIHPEIMTLSMWDRMGMPARPTIDLALDWVDGFYFGHKFEKGDKARLFQILRKAPDKVLERFDGAWINIEGKWCRKDDLKYAATNLGIAICLFDNIKQRTADFSMLDDRGNELIARCRLINIQNTLQYMPGDIEAIGRLENKPWIQALGTILTRLKILNENEDTESSDDRRADRESAERLRNTGWQKAERLTIVPYINGEAVGAEKPCKVAWQGSTLYAVGTGPSHHRDLVEELSRFFSSSLIKKVIADCIDRDPEWISAYAEENLELVAETKMTKSDKPEGTTETEPETPIDKTDIETPEDEEPEEDPTTRRRRQDRLKEAFKSYIAHKGYTWHEYGSCFIHEDDKRKIFSAEAPFQWAEYEENYLARKYFVCRGSIENGVQLPAELWSTNTNVNYDITLVLVEENKASSLSLFELRRMISKGNAEIYPTKYRIRIKERVGS